MLVLRGRVEGGVRFANETCVFLMDDRKDNVKLGIDVPRDVMVDHEGLYMDVRLC